MIIDELNNIFIDIDILCFILSNIGNYTFIYILVCGLDLWCQSHLSHTKYNIISVEYIRLYRLDKFDNGLSIYIRIQMLLVSSNFISAKELSWI